MANDEQTHPLRSGDPTSDLWSTDLSADHDKHYRSSDDYDRCADDYDRSSDDYDYGTGDDYHDGAGDNVDHYRSVNFASGPIDHGSAFHHFAERSAFYHPRCGR